MKKMMLIGNIGCGKTTLCQRLHDQELTYKKTQMVEYFPSTIDTPGEYIQNPGLQRALIVTAADCGIVGLVQSASDDTCYFPPGFSSVFASNKDVIGIVTKSECGPVKDAEEKLRLAGAKDVFAVSAMTGEGIARLSDYLERKAY